MTSVEIFVIIVCAVLGYLTVSHFVRPKPGAKSEPAGDPKPAARRAKGM